jgi:serine/threonine protein kinase
MTDYLVGGLPRARHEAVTDHIDGCADCQTRIERLSLANDSLHADLRGPAPTGRYEPERAIGGDALFAPSGGSGDTTDFRSRPLPQGAIPTRIGDYEILEVIAKGGMGVVYKARQRSLDRVVALKMILAGEFADVDQLRRFQMEAEAIARLQHPNIVQIFECGASDGKPYLALEYCAGGSLAARLDGAPLPPVAVARLVEQLARAVAAAHRAGIIHRDLKPANVLLASRHSEEDEGTRRRGDAATKSDGDPVTLSPNRRIAPSPFGGEEVVPKVSDFGLAKKVDDESGQTRSGSILGTPSYMAPEQALGSTQQIGPPADTYALGAILYELLAGRPPFEGASILETLEQVRTREPVSPSLLRPRTPRDLETICLKCLSKEPGKRYASAADLADDLLRYQQGEPIRAGPVGRLERAVKWVKRNPILAGAAATVAVVLVAGVIVSSAFAVEANFQAKEARDYARKADDKAKEALHQKGEAEEREREARFAQRKAEFVAYASRVREAQVDLDRGRLPDALRVLHQNTPPFSGWEHDYLLRQTQRGRWTNVSHSGPVNGVAYSPDGKRIASGSGDATVRVFDAATGRVLLTLKGHTAGVSSVAFSRDGKRIVAGSWDQTVKVWEIGTDKVPIPPRR